MDVFAAEESGREAEPLLLSCENATVGWSLLFAHALERALAGETVLIVSASRRALEQTPFARPDEAPGWPSDAAATEAALARVQLKYVGSDALLCQFLASVHLLRPPALGLLVVEDVLAFSSESVSAAVTHSRLQRTLALALNAAEYLAAAQPADQPRRCRLVVSATESALPLPFSVAAVARKHFFRQRLRVSGPLERADSKTSFLGEYSVVNPAGQLARVLISTDECATPQTPPQLQLQVYRA
ncbi:hypothetical protein T492DRAFT_940291 [Pavlovales sp. CCMP2436]|nr:hypothetical protein T492DRAFT_940291 [Pavlovales sp. CCMP2436]